MFDSSTLKLFLMAMLIAALMGLVAKLRENQKPALREMCISMFVGAMAGLLIALLTYDSLISRGLVTIFLAISGIVGFGGYPVLDLLANGMVRIMRQKMRSNGNGNNDEK